MDSAEDKIAVSADLARLIHDKVAEGSYGSPAEVVEAAMQALEREARDRAEDLAWVKAQIRASIEDPGPDYSSEEVFGDIRRRLEAKAAGGFHEAPARPLE